MKKYIRVMLGPKSVFAEECYKGSFIGADFDIHEDLTDNLPENWRDFNSKYRQVWLENNPGRSTIDVAYILHEALRNGGIADISCKTAPALETAITAITNRGQAKNGFLIIFADILIC